MRASVGGSAPPTRSTATSPRTSTSTASTGRPTAITWRLDDVAYRTLARADVPTWAFDGDMFLLVNLALGGRRPGNDLDATSLPATMLVDRVRVLSRR
jgi:hypothetical protein